MYLCNSGAWRSQASFPVDSRITPSMFRSSGSTNITFNATKCLKPFNSSSLSALCLEWRKQIRGLKLYNRWLHHPMSNCFISWYRQRQVALQLSRSKLKTSEGTTIESRNPTSDFWVFSPYCEGWGANPIFCQNFWNNVHEIDTILLSGRWEDAPLSQWLIFAHIFTTVRPKDGEDNVFSLSVCLAEGVLPCL